VTVGRALAPADDPLHLGMHRVARDAQRDERPGPDARGLAEEAEQDVLGADVVVIQ
jgi:hypothetical protein